MQHIVRLVYAVALLGSTPGSAAAQTVNFGEPVTLPFSQSTTMRATTTGREYRIFVALPEDYSQDHEPYPVLYAADANAEFLTLVEAVRLAVLGGEIPPLVIVGIGYDLGTRGLGAMMGPRILDLTPTRDTAYEARAKAAAQALGYSAPDGTGGAPAFLEFIQSDLIPTIEQQYNVSRVDRGWFGHSAGGLFGVYVMLQHDRPFNRFLLGSPYLAWGQRVMFNLESSYAATHRSMPVRVFFAAGGNESASMLENLRALASRLDQRRYEALEYMMHVFEGEGHDAVIPATMSRGIRYLYGKSQ